MVNSPGGLPRICHLQYTPAVILQLESIVAGECELQPNIEQHSSQHQSSDQ